MHTPSVPSQSPTNTQIHSYPYFYQQNLQNICSNPLARQQNRRHYVHKKLARYNYLTVIKKSTPKMNCQILNLSFLVVGPPIFPSLINKRPYFRKYISQRNLDSFRSNIEVYRSNLELQSLYQHPVWGRI